MLKAYRVDQESYRAGCAQVPMRRYRTRLMCWRSGVVASLPSRTSWASARFTVSLFHRPPRHAKMSSNRDGRPKTVSAASIDSSSMDDVVVLSPPLLACGHIARDSCPPD